jgi:phospholipase C
MKKRSRRQILQGLGAVVGVTATGCGRSATEALSQNGFEPPLPAGFPKDPAEPSPTATPTLSPAELLASVDTVVVLMMENRSFDHFLGSLSLVEGRPVNGLTGLERNPDPTGALVAPFVLDDFTPEDPPHGWDSVHRQWNDGAMDGFVTEHAGASQNEVMGYHLRGQLPSIYGLADQFAVCDAWHCSVMGPTWPNRYYLHGGTSNGVKTNVPAFGFKNVFDVLTAAGVPSRTYFHDLAFQAGYLNFNLLSPIEQFFQDAQSGTLPAFTVIDPKFQGNDANDDHPDHDVQLGQALIASIYAALAASPQWGRMLFVVTYDEHGGFYDHVAPPECADDHEEFRRLGMRVPSIVAGPMVRAGAVVNTTFDHSSIIATLTTRHGLEPMTARSAAANDLSSCIDPSLIAQPRRAPQLAPVTISLGKLAEKMRQPIHRRLQPELQDLADRGEIPRHLDRRAEGADVTRRVLEAGQRLGALRLTR